MGNMTEAELTEVVLERYASTPDPRLRTVLQSLIRHLHAFVRDVRAIRNASFSVFRGGIAPLDSAQNSPVEGERPYP